MEEVKELMSIQSTGKSVDEAIFKGLQQMEISIDEVTIEIIQQETKGILGFGAKPAIVRLTQRPPEEYEVPDYMREAEERRQRRNERVKPDRRDRRRDDKRDERSDKDRSDKDRKGFRRNNEQEQTARPVFDEIKSAVETANAYAKAAEDEEPVPAAAEASEQREQREPRRQKERREPREPRAEKNEAEANAEPAVEEVINYTLEAAQNCPAAIFVNGLIEHMGAPGQVLAAETEDSLKLRIDSEKMGMLIGHRGETLDAMQYLTSLVINRNRKTEGYTRVTLNTEDYREKREETLRRLAKKVAAQVKATGRAKTLEPMNPYERRVLHSTLQNHPYVTTHSEGDEPNRRVVVTPRRRSRGGYRKPRYEKAAGAENIAQESIETGSEE